MATRSVWTDVDRSYCRTSGNDPYQVRPWVRANAAAAVRESRFNLVRIEWTWTLVVGRLMKRASAISWLDLPCATSLSTSHSRGLRPKAGVGSDCRGVSGPDSSGNRCARIGASASLTVISRPAAQAAWNASSPEHFTN